MLSIEDFHTFVKRDKTFHEKMLIQAMIILSTTHYSGKTFEDIWEILHDEAIHTFKL